MAALLPAMAAAMVVPGPDADTCAGPVLVFETPASGECNAEVALAPPPWVPDLVPPANPWLARRPAQEPRLDPGLRVVRAGAAGGWQLQYRVGRGESLGAIAARFRARVTDLLATNGLRSPRHLVAGRWLHIPSPLDAVHPERYARLPESIRAQAHRLLLIAHFERWAAEYELPPDLLEAVAWVESRWQANALSNKGAMGIGQLTADTVDFVSAALLRRPCDPWVPEDNIRMSARFLRYLLGETNDLADALAAYYQGLGALRAHGRYAVAEPYVDAVLAARALFVQPAPDESAAPPPASADSDAPAAPGSRPTGATG